MKYNSQEYREFIHETLVKVARYRVDITRSEWCFETYWDYLINDFHEMQNCMDNNEPLGQNARRILLLLEEMRRMVAIFHGSLDKYKIQSHICRECKEAIDLYDKAMKPIESEFDGFFKLSGWNSIPKIPI
jgi:hypothetical protein